MKNISIIGAGAFGTAMACVAARSGNRVTLWAREPEVAESIARTRENALFLPGATLPGTVTVTRELEAAVADAHGVLMAVPAQHVRATAASLARAWRPGLPVVSCSKGVESASGALMPEVLRDMLPDAVVAALSGPSFAHEIARELPCGVALACREWEVAEMLGRALGNGRFCVHVTDDVTGVALGGAMKNVIAIASGVVHGLALGEDARATVITLGLQEAVRLGRVKGARAETFLGLSGAGDFMLTAQSLQSRNTTLGVAIGQGRKASEVVAERRQVTEGFHSVAGVLALARQHEVDMPLTAALDAILNRGMPVSAAVAAFMRELPPLCRTGQDEAAADPAVRTHAEIR